MKAIIINKFGDSSEFKTSEFQKPTINKNQVLLKVEGTNINPADIMMRQGSLPLINQFPAILHTDVTGTIIELGENVENFRLGQSVLGFAGVVNGRQGALADFMAVDENLIVLAPENLSVKEIAALPMISVTAWEAVVEKANTKSGEKILIHGGVGGVGHMAIQIAKSFGAIVYTTVGSIEDEKLALRLGADFVINYKSETVENYTQKYTNGTGFDVVIDTVGGTNFETSLKATKVYGRLVSTYLWGQVDMTEAANKSIHVFPINIWIPMVTNIRPKYHRNMIQKVVHLISKEQLKPLVNDRNFTFDEVTEAHDFAASKSGVGKIVLLNN